MRATIHLLSLTISSFDDLYSVRGEAFAFDIFNNDFCSRGTKYTRVICFFLHIKRHYDIITMVEHRLEVTVLS